MDRDEKVNIYMEHIGIRVFDPPLPLTLATARYGPQIHSVDALFSEIRRLPGFVSATVEKRGDHEPLKIVIDVDAGTDCEASTLAIRAMMEHRAAPVEGGIDITVREVPRG